MNTYEAVFSDKFVPLDKQKRVGNYRLGDVIGSGAFGTVRTARHLVTGSEVAIKVVPKKSVLHKDRAKRRFIRETHALKRLEHPHIVKLLAWMETEKNFYLVMEYISGDTMKKYVQKRGKLNEADSKLYIGQITQGVHYMHGQGIIHRDLKLANIVLEKSDEKRAKIVDLGLSVNLNRVESSKLCGSLHYMAPEVLDRMAFSTAVDVWSLGVCLHHMVTGSHPFHHTSIRNMSNMYFHILRGFSLPDYLTEACKDLITQMLQLDPSVRISTSNILSHPWIGS